MARFKQINIYLAAALLIACVAAFPLLAQPGLLNTRGGGDSPFLLQRLHQLETAVFDGHFPVRWMPDANYGYGYPFFNYYAPLSIYVAFFFRLPGFSFVRAIQLAQVAGFLVAAWGMFTLARRWFGSDWAGLLTAVVYTLAPFHLVNVYVRGDSLAEFWAMAFYPLVILAAERVLCARGGREKRVGIAYLGITYAGLILSHNISALIFSPFLMLYVLLRWISLSHDRSGTVERPDRFQKPVRSAEHVSRRHVQLRHAARNVYALIPPLLAGLLGLSLAAWFFIPALAETSLAQLGSVTEGYFFYGSHFLGSKKLPLVQNSFFFDFSVNGRKAFRMGLVQAVLAAFSLVVLLWMWGQNRLHKADIRQTIQATANHPATAAPPFREVLSTPYLFLLITILLTTFMMLSPSQWLWEKVPLLSFTQFPWRFLSVQAFGLALAAGAVGMMPGRRIFVPGIVTICAISSLGQLRTDHLILTDADITAEKLAQYEWFTGNIGTTVSAEYLPQTVQPRPYTSAWLHSGIRDQVTVMKGNVEHVTLLDRKTGRQQWRVGTAVPATIRFDTLYWLGWTARVDGEAVPIRPSAGSGLIEVDLLPGVHQVELRLTRTPVRLWAELLSLTAVMIAVWLLRPEHRRPLKPVTAYTVLSVTALVMIVRLWPERQLQSNTLNWDFAQMGYLHHAPEGIPFANGAYLLGYEIDKDQVQAGEAVTISLEWAGDLPETTVVLASPAVNRPELSPAAPALVSQSSRQTRFALTIPETAPAGLYVPRITLADGRSLTSAGHQRGELFLRPIRIVNNVPVTDTGRELDGQVVAVKLLQADVLDVQMAWLTERPLSHNYNVALRLTDADGNFLRLADHQPGYGYLPSSGWPTGEWVYDWHTMPLPPADEGHQQPFMLVAQLYEVADPAQVRLTRRLGEFTREGETIVFQAIEPVFTVPADMIPVTAVFGDVIQLRGYTFSQTEGTLQLELVWEALTNGSADYIRFLHLTDPLVEGNPLAQVDSMPRNHSYPTSQWTAGEIVTETVSLNLEGISAGNYQLAVGFYQLLAGGDGRLTAVDEAGNSFDNNRFLLPVTITIP